jgi:hypothetical protein
LEICYESFILQHAQHRRAQLAVGCDNGFFAGILSIANAGQ